MTLVQFTIFVASVAGIVAIIHYNWDEIKEWPRNAINTLKPYSCKVCKRKYWSSRTSFNCCKGTPEHDAWLRSIRHPTPPRERDCPRCHGKPGNYMCPMCEGRGKTFIR